MAEAPNGRVWAARAGMGTYASATMRPQRRRAGRGPRVRMLKSCLHNTRANALRVWWACGNGGRALAMGEHRPRPPRPARGGPEWEVGCRGRWDLAGRRVCALFMIHFHYMLNVPCEF